MSMFEVPRTSSTATMSTGDGTKDEREAAASSSGGGMSDEARAAMMDVAPGYTTSTVDGPPAAGRKHAPRHLPNDVSTVADQGDRARG